MLDTANTVLNELVTKGLLDKTLSLHAATIIAVIAGIEVLKRWGSSFLILFKFFQKRRIEDHPHREEDSKTLVPTRINGHPCVQHEILANSVAILTTQADRHHREQKAELLSVRRLVETSFTEINKKSSEQSVVLGQHSTAIEYISKAIDSLNRR